MRFSKTVKSQKHPFVDEQIRAKAYQISQKYRQNSPEENLKAAIKALEIERFFQPLRTVWQWSGIGEKKGWDFLQLLIVPIVLAVAGNSLQDFAKQRERNQQIIDKKREQEAATEKAYQDTLVKYQDQMADLLQKGLLKTKMSSETFIIAQVKTVTALQSLDPTRQHLIIQFLDASKLNILPSKNGILHEAKMTKAMLMKADLSGANLSGTNFSNANLGEANLNSTNLNRAILSGANLSRAILSGANLSNANLSNVDLSNVDLSNANLSNANLSNANLSSVNLSGAFLYQIDLSNVNLNKANLKGVKLINVNLKDSNLSGADLNGADLSGADPKGAKLCKTTLQDGKINNDDCSKF